MPLPPRRAAVVFALAPLGFAMGNGVLRHGFGAADAGTAGAFAETRADALTAMQVNPASLAALGENEWTFSLRGVTGDGEFTRSGRRYDMDRSGVIPELALAWRDGDSPWTFGVSVAALSALEADWLYPDAPGGIGGISYGLVGHDSGFKAVRGNAGVSFALNENLSFGATIGALYSEVDFDAPFIFQSNPALAGAKVDLDLNTSGWDAISEFGMLWRPDKRWSVGIHARPKVTLEHEGSAVADFSAQLPGVTPTYNHYEAVTRNALPLVAGLGISWQAADRLRLGMSADWIQWSAAFDQLEVGLSQGTNPVINGAIGPNVADRVPVGWKDRWVIALGAEFDLSDSWVLRGGWRYGESPQPAALVTPLNAALPEHTLALGLGWKSGPWSLDASYEVQFGDARKVATSGYRAGEYSNSSLDFTVQALTFGVTRRF
ncbi:OmpP1/FadL family transporter [Luteolibacter soli]|uniref:Outer membrane protein transport protein n=1 Tax=Luteolibacter soli TaxID=3135280 RepID=A0ABU9AP56_9BACT